MKKFMALFLLLSLILTGCAGQNPGETTAAPTETPVTAPPTTQASTEAPTEPPTEPAEPAEPINPLTGETLEAPLESRFFAVSINNVPAAMPMYGVSKADLFFEMFVNDYCTRGLALYADISEASAVGSVRSLRYNFTDLCQSYDAIVAHCSGSAQVMSDLYASGVPNVNVESEGSGYYFRDRDRNGRGYAWEHCLFIKGPDIQTYAQSKGIRTTRDPDRDYGLIFARDAAPDGEEARKITINLKHGGITKQTIMEYDEEAGQYLFHQFGKPMYDEAEKQDVLFENVIVMLCNVYDEGVYHIAELVGSGEGYFACNGKLIPIRWIHESMDQPILFTHPDGIPLELSVGSSYIAIAPLKSTIEYE